MTNLYKIFFVALYIVLIQYIVAFKVMASDLNPVSEILEGNDYIETPDYNNKKLNYYYYIPQIVNLDRKQSHPVLVVLADPLTTRDSIITENVKNYASEKGFVIVAPEFNYDQESVDNKTSYHYPSIWSGKALLKINHHIKRFKIKTSGIYFLSFSDGAEFAIRFSLWNPDMVVACSANDFKDSIIPLEKNNVSFFISYLSDLNNDSKNYIERFCHVAKMLGIDVVFQQFDTRDNSYDIQINESLNFFNDVKYHYSFK
ncbi:MAG: hypothetical protein AB1782_18600 [Cyanobacteriota bacterium]